MSVVGNPRGGSAIIDGSVAPSRHGIIDSGKRQATPLKRTPDGRLVGESWYIFSQLRDRPFDGGVLPGFAVIDTPLAFIRHAHYMLAYQGAGAIKQFAKSFSRRRPCYILIDQGRIVGFGTLAIGFCRDYPVEDDAVVIGTVWTDEAMRGRGLATAAIRAAMNYMIARGTRKFYIDTAQSNYPMLRSIGKLEFGVSSGKFVIGDAS